MTEKPLANTYNPYKFFNPITDPDLFVGRATELAEIEYYLDQAKRAPHPTNIAILGARGLGKTSLLNMACVNSLAGSGFGGAHWQCAACGAPEYVW